MNWATTVARVFKTKMLQNINPTRMELTRLKKKIIMARRGHKLLKDKQDELMKKMLEITSRIRKLRKKMVSDYQQLLAQYGVARNINPAEAIRGPGGSGRVKITAEYRNIMSVMIPEYSLSFADNKDAGPSMESPALLSVHRDFVSFLPQLFDLVGLQKQAELISHELEKTRRRVNALEYVLIPDITESISYINFKLSETERGNTIRLLKVKDILLQEAQG